MSSVGRRIRAAASRGRKVHPCERRRADHHHVCRHRMRFPPARLDTSGFARRQASRPEQRAVRHHRATSRRAHRPAHRRLVARVVDGGQPLPRAVGPVVAEPGPAASLILAHDQPVGHRAVVAHPHLHAVAGGARERDIDRVLRVRGMHVAAIHLHLLHREAVHEIEPQHLHARRSPSGDDHVATNHRAGVGQFQRDVVVNDVDAGRVGVAGEGASGLRGGARGAQKQRRAGSRVTNCETMHVRRSGVRRKDHPATRTASRRFAARSPE